MKMTLFLIAVFIATFCYLVTPGKVHTPSQRGSIAGGSGMF